MRPIQDGRWASSTTNLHIAKTGTRSTFGSVGRGHGGRLHTRQALAQDGKDTVGRCTGARQNHVHPTDRSGVRSGQVSFAAASPAP